MSTMGPVNIERLAFLKANPQLTRRQMADKLGIKLDYVHSLLRRYGIVHAGTRPPKPPKKKSKFFNVHAHENWII